MNQKAGIKNDMHGRAKRITAHSIAYAVDCLSADRLLRLTMYCAALMHEELDQRSTDGIAVPGPTGEPS